jgi:PAS domain S-box-containing protein
MSRTINSRKILALATLLPVAMLISASVALVVQRRTSHLLERPFRIGFYNTPGSHFPGPDGKPQGDAVDLLNEAARRAGIKLEWVYSPEGPDAALETGNVDLWPIIGDLPERDGHLYVSPPWTITDFGLISRKNDPVSAASQSYFLKVAGVSKRIESKLALRIFPNAKYVYVDDVEEQLRDVCDGQAQVAVVTQTQSFDQFTMPEACRNVGLQLVGAPDLSIRFGIGATYTRPGAVQAANKLQSELGGMTKDGTLESIEFQWLDPSLPQTRAVFYLLAAERSERLLAAAAMVLAIILVVLAWLVTDRKRAEEKLFEERRLLRTLIDSMPDRIYLKDDKSRWVVANRALAKLVGENNPDELLGKTDFDYFPHKLAEAFYSDEQAIIRSGEPILNQEEQATDTDGNKRWTATTKVPWRDRLGNVIGVMGIGRDITERKSAEENFYLAFNASPEPITIATLAQGRYLDVNESFLKATGYQREEVIGHTSLELKIWDSSEDRARLLEHLRDHGSVRDFQVTFRAKSGEQRVWLHSVNRIEFAGEECLISSQKDITSQKILETQLRQSQKMEAVGQLTGGIAHDFNNLLGIIIGYSELLEEGLGENEKLCKNAGEIKKAGQRAASLTRQLLAFSRQQVLEPKVLNLNHIVAETQKMLRRLIGEHIELSTCLAADLGQVKADQGQIDQVILNLAVNARDAMPDGGKLLIETSNVELNETFAVRHPPTVPGSYVALVVTDSGIGMDAETQAHMFEPFFTTKEVGKGTGLGLATVYGVVKQSGGYIWVYSELGLGTTFRIYLPRVDEPVERRTSNAAGPALERRSETILLVEDEELLRTLTRTLLEHGGYKVLEASDGAEAIEIARSHREPIGLMLTDMVMPGMSGPEVAQSFAPMHPEAKVVFMSGYTNFTGRAILAADANFIQKPFTREVLLAKLRHVLELQNQPQTI